MSKAYNGNDMDPSYNSPGSVRRAREQAQGMLYRDHNQTQRPPPLLNPRPVEAAPRSRPLLIQTGPQPRPRKGGPPLGPPLRFESNPEHRIPEHRIPEHRIPRPRQEPQWPLTGQSVPPPVQPESNWQPRPPGRPQQMPRRPPRPSPSRIPSMLDQSRPQQPTPNFVSRPTAPDYSHDSTVDSYDVSIPSGSSARQTTSTMGTIPDVPVPAPASESASAANPRKNAALGPPPSSRRGASTFYSSASYVSPIAEETPRTNPHESLASSSAMPDQSRSEAPRSHSPMYEEAFYEESFTEKSRESTFDDYGDESQLVRSASLGRKGKPALVNTKPSGQGAVNAGQETVSSLQTTTENDPYLTQGTSSSETIPASRNLPRSHKQTTHGDSISSDAILKAFAAASSSDVKESIPLADAPRQPRRLSAMRRPPRLDMDAVRAAEARGSLTSLPDLILRATRLASMIDKGKRPASRLDALDAWTSSEKDERHKSGFSDMLAAFPPPVHTPRNNVASRLSWLRNSGWPGVKVQDGPGHSRTPSGQMVIKPKRRCCGLPIWAFILLVILALCIIAAAVVIPLEFFVFKNLGSSDNNTTPQPSLSQCQQTLPCLNGGRSLFAQDKCSCICTNGFTGPTCGGGGSTGCAMTDLVSMDGQSHIQNVTLGRAIPRLIAGANQNYSVPLFGTTILARFNAENLSCIAQNSLVTFDGRSTRLGQPTDEVDDLSDKQANMVSNAGLEHFPPISVLSLARPVSTGGEGPQEGTGVATPATPMKATTTSSPGWAPAITPNSPNSSTEKELPQTLVVDTGSVATRRSDPTTSAFLVTEEKADFARVAMLYILQEGSVEKAISAQGELQQLFSRVSRSKKERGMEVSILEASNLDLGSGYNINMVDLTVNVGKGAVGRGTIKARHVQRSLLA
ncbi:hypothetical protein E4U13_007508 [Claviceps humidiphila]|uniref:EGF-like domain-containing protein n=1 Tax=Claviceps humidiphila TaxID=1294629 RepID=A0A9P7PTV7_9HYPO|nr:hypothetical protein E4U13_007508 [Claviceps humidiphila]